MAVGKTGTLEAGASPDRALIERELTTIVTSLLSELGSLPGRPIGPSDSLDRDLGLGSLERVELLLRIEHAFSVRLADDVMVAADTIADLATAVLAGAPKRLEALPVAAPIGGEGVAAPRSARSLVEALVWQAERNPDRAHLLLREDAGEERTITYGELWSRAQAVATGLRQRNLGIGETVSLMLRTEEAFFASFFGILLAGGVPVPIYPPFRLDRLEEYAHRQVGILRNAQAVLLITFDEATRIAGLLRSRVPSLREVVTVDRLAVSGRRPGMHARQPGPRLDPVHLGQHRGAEGRAPLARQPARQHSRDRRGARSPTGRCRGELASALPRHGADRDMAHGIVLRAADRGDVTARLPVAAVALAVERARAPRHALACAELRLRALRPCAFRTRTSSVST